MKDKSFIMVPAISTVKVFPKLETDEQEDLKYHNGIFLKQESLSKLVPKTLVRIWKNGNKIYIFDEQTSNIENISNYISSQNINYLVTDNADNSKKVSFVNNSVNNIFTKNNDFVNFYNNPSPSTFFNTVKIKTKDIFIDKVEQLKNKKVIIYTLNDQITEEYSDLVSSTKKDISSLFAANIELKIKSMFAKESKVSNIDKYVLSNTFFPSVDKITNQNFNIENKIDNIKSELSAPLFEQDLKVVRNFSIASSKLIKFNNKFVKKYENIIFVDTTKEINISSKTFTLMNTRGNLVINQDNKKYFENNILIFSLKGDSIMKNYYVIKPQKFFDLNTSDTFKEPVTNKEVAFSYEQLKYFGIKIEKPISFKWEQNNSTRKKSAEAIQYDRIYDLQIIKPNDYVEFFEKDATVLELEMFQNDSNNFSTKTQGDFYIMEIE